MIKKSFLLKIFNASCMQRWNDKLRPIELTEMDKQAHKMMIAYILGKMVEDKGEDVSWIRIIEGGIYEYMLRAALTDIKPPVFYSIKKQTARYHKMIDWAYKIWEPLIGNLEERFIEEKNFCDYHKRKEGNKDRNILEAAHKLATHWEYDYLLEQFNQKDYEKDTIKTRHLKESKNCKKEGFHYIGNDLERLVNFCGQLRFQVRWGHLHRVPRTSVLGHLLFVAIITYIISLELGKAPNQRYCNKRLYNNFFTGLFHDLPEALTRDIISPIKETGIDKIIKKLEAVEMENKILKYLPDDAWKDEIRLFTGILKDSKGKQLSEFSNVYLAEGKCISLPSDDMTNFNEDSNKRRDGSIVKAADHLAAFIEAFVAIENGCSSKDLNGALYKIKSEFDITTPQGNTFAPKGSDPATFKLMREIYSEF